MEKLSLLLIVTLATCFNAFSQRTYPSYSELKNSGFSNTQIPGIFDNLNTLPSNESKFDTLFFDKSDTIRELPNLNSGETKLFQNQDYIQVIPNPEPAYSMQLVKPSGNYPILIHEPDSTKNYTLLIKDLNLNPRPE